MDVLWLIMLNNDRNVDKNFYPSILNRSRKTSLSPKTSLRDRRRHLNYRVVLLLNKESYKNEKFINIEEFCKKKHQVMSEFKNTIKLINQM